MMEPLSLGLGGAGAYDSSLELREVAAYLRGVADTVAAFQAQAPVPVSEWCTARSAPPAPVPSLSKRPTVPNLVTVFPSFAPASLLAKAMPSSHGVSISVAPSWAPTSKRPTLAYGLNVVPSHAPASWWAAEMSVAPGLEGRDARLRELDTVAEACLGGRNGAAPWLATSGMPGGLQLRVPELSTQWYQLVEREEG
jgi:hypothetical protein